MPTAPTPEKADVEAARRDIAGAMATLANRPAAATSKRQLTGRERAAIFMLALGVQYGGEDDDELRQLSVVMSTIGNIEAELVEGLLLEFVTRMSASGALMGNLRSD